MKTSILLFLIFTSCNSYVADIEINNLKKEYTKDDVILFCIFNNSESEIFYYVTIEVEFESTWREIPIYDNKHSIKTDQLTTITEKSKENEKINIKDFYNNCQKYRIVINYGLPNESINKKFYSESFLIK